MKVEQLVIIKPICMHLTPYQRLFLSVEMTLKLPFVARFGHKIADGGYIIVNDRAVLETTVRCVAYQTLLAILTVSIY